MTVHLWVRAESRPNEQRVGITPDGVAALIAQGFRVTVEHSRYRAIGYGGFAAAGAEVVAEGSWPDAPREAIIFGLKELPEDGSALPHRHIMFGHAFKGQASGPALLRRFRDGGGALYDLEYLTDADGRRVAAFGYWAGFAGAAVGVMTLATQYADGGPGPSSVGVFGGRDALVEDLRARLAAAPEAAPRAIVIGALGRVGTGACDLFDALGIPATRWDMAETAHGGPFPEILDHEIFVNCILANPGVPVFVAASAVDATRRLSVIADVSCDPDSDYNPIPVYDHATSFDDPVIRVAERSGQRPPLDVTAIDNLPSMLPVESSEDYAAQLLPSLMQLDKIDDGVWGRAYATYQTHLKDL